MHNLYSGQYKLQVISLDGRIKHETDWFDNLITNVGLDTYGKRAENTFRAYIGTGSSVSELDTSMAAVATTTSVTTAGSSQNVTLPYWWKVRYVFTFAVGAYVGTITDVGVGWGTGTLVSFTPLYSHALLPTPVTLGNIDQVILTYDHYYCFSDYIRYTFELNGITTNGIAKPTISESGNFANIGRLYYDNLNGFRPNHFHQNCVIDDLNQLGSGFKSYGTGFEAYPSTQVVDSYVIGSFKTTITNTWIAETGNYTNVNGYVMYTDWSRWNTAYFAIVLTPAFTKTDLQRLMLITEFSWDRTAVPV